MWPASPPPHRPSLLPWPNPCGHQPSSPARRVAPLPTPAAADIPVPPVSPLLHPLPLTAGPHLSAGAVPLSPPHRHRPSLRCSAFCCTAQTPSPLHDNGAKPPAASRAAPPALLASPLTTSAAPLPWPPRKPQHREPPDPCHASVARTPKILAISVPGSESQPWRRYKTPQSAAVNPMARGFFPLPPPRA